MGVNSWSFPPAKGTTVSRAVQFAPRLVVDSDRSAIASAVEGHGVTRVFSFQVADAVRDGRLQVLLSGDEYPPMPIHLIMPDGRLSVPKVRAFVDFVVPRLRSQLARLALDAGR
jgi:DNA-binding transcriptional LysR family regulator